MPLKLFGKKRHATLMINIPLLGGNHHYYHGEHNFKVGSVELCFEGCEGCLKQGIIVLLKYDPRFAAIVKECIEKAEKTE